MSIKTFTVKKQGDNGQLPPEGWSEVTIIDAHYDTWASGDQYLTFRLKEFPLMEVKVSEKFGANGEEFAVSNVFKLTGAGIVKKLVDDNEDDVFQFDSSAENLNNCRLNICFYKKYNPKHDRSFLTPFYLFAPIEFDNGVISYNGKDVKYFMSRADEKLSAILRAQKEVEAKAKAEEKDESSDELPF